MNEALKIVNAMLDSGETPKDFLRRKNVEPQAKTRGGEKMITRRAAAEKAAKALPLIDHGFRAVHGDNLVECPVCHHTGWLMEDWSLLWRGFGGIELGDPDDVNMQECGVCGAWSTWTHLDDGADPEPLPEGETPKDFLRRKLATIYVIAWKSDRETYYLTRDIIYRWTMHARNAAKFTTAEDAEAHRRRVAQDNSTAQVASVRRLHSIRPQQESEAPKAFLARTSRVRRLTHYELERLVDIFARGPLTRRASDQIFFDLGLVQAYDDMPDTVDANPKAHYRVFSRNGGVRDEWFPLPKTEQ